MTASTSSTSAATGNPLFLTQLAAHESGELPPSIVENMRARLAPLGTAGASLRAAAVIGMTYRRRS